MHAPHNSYTEATYYSQVHFYYSGEEHEVHCVLHVIIISIYVPQASNIFQLHYITDI